MSRIQEDITIPAGYAGKRLDQVAAELFPDFSRSRLQEWIKQGDILLAGEIVKPKHKVSGGETLVLDAFLEEINQWQAEDIPLYIQYEDDHILVLNKPADMVVHPAPGNRSGTLLNGLLHYAQENGLQLSALPRAGIVHRIDKGTTGLLVVAKTLEAHSSLVRQLQKKTVTRHYEAITLGSMTGGGSVEEPIGRHRALRTRMAVVEGGKDAVTHYRLVKRYRAHTHISVQLETGRTHQIRVHMAHIRYPLLGDPLYSGRMQLPRAATPELREGIRLFKRQALHARKLGLIHPATQEYMEWEVAIPKDMQDMLSLIEQDNDIAS